MTYEGIFSAEILESAQFVPWLVLIFESLVGIPCLKSCWSMLELVALVDESRGS